jgi:hypothetical protein
MARNRKNWLGPFGSGYFFLLILGMVIIWLAMTLLDELYEFTPGIATSLLSQRPVCLIVVILVLFLIGASLYWLGYRQGKKRM